MGKLIISLLTILLMVGCHKNQRYVATIPADFDPDSPAFQELLVEFIENHMNPVCNCRDILEDLDESNYDRKLALLSTGLIEVVQDKVLCDRIYTECRQANQHSVSLSKLLLPDFKKKMNESIKNYGGFSQNSQHDFVEQISKKLIYQQRLYDTELYIPNFDHADFTQDPILAVGIAIDDSDNIFKWVKDQKGFWTCGSLSESEVLNATSKGKNRPIIIVNPGLYNDPGVCGNGICEGFAGEDQNSCPQDCHYNCGNCTCEARRGEDNSNCPDDCPPNPYDCGDGFCDLSIGETNCNCPKDCISNKGPCPDCSNGIQDCNETGIDCGGPDCNPCCVTSSGPCADGNNKIGIVLKKLRIDTRYERCGKSEVWVNSNEWSSLSCDIGNRPQGAQYGKLWTKIKPNQIGVTISAGLVVDFQTGTTVTPIWSENCPDRMWVIYEYDWYVRGRNSQELICDCGGNPLPGLYYKAKFGLEFYWSHCSEPGYCRYHYDGAIYEWTSSNAYFYSEKGD